MPSEDEELLLPGNSNSARYTDLSYSTKEANQSCYKRFLDLFPARYVIAFWAFMGFFNVYALRVNLTVALVAMVNLTSVENVSHDCPSPHLYGNDSTSSITPEFNWDGNLVGTVQAAFFYGYVVTQIPGGWLAERYGSKNLFGFGILWTAALTLLTPVMARFGVYYLIALRVLEGFGEGVTFPAMHSMWSKWAPEHEKTKLTTLSYGGTWLGTVVAMPVSGYLAQSNLAGGWPSVFYIEGACGCAWFLVWMVVAYDTPAKHPRITEQEKDYILMSIGQETASLKSIPVPWLSIIRSTAVWSIAMSMFCSGWALYIVLTSMPLYMSSILRFNLESNSTLSALPHLIAWFSSIPSGMIADWLRRKKYLSTELVRKLFSTFAHTLQAGSLILVVFMGCNYVGAIIAFCTCMVFNSLNSAGAAVNQLDIAPRLAGTLYGYTNSFANLAGVLSNQIAGVLTNGPPSILKWHNVFYVGACMNLFGAAFYIIFGRGEPQPWSNCDDMDEEEKERIYRIHRAESITVY